ncbi:hypothetical protein [Acrocarpospora phusangensis]|nr:hypothetical protein [Acrocarpospora phusangensis]
MRTVVAVIAGLVGAGLGLGAGYLAWLLLWSLPWLSDPVVTENGVTTINDPFDALGKLLTYIGFPAVGALFGAAILFGLARGTAKK